MRCFARRCDVRKLRPSKCSNYQSTALRILHKSVLYNVQKRNQLLCRRRSTIYRGHLQEVKPYRTTAARCSESTQAVCGQQITNRSRTPTHTRKKLTSPAYSHTNSIHTHTHTHTQAQS